MRRVCVAAILVVVAIGGSPLGAQELLALAGAFGASQPGPLEQEQVECQLTGVTFCSGISTRLCQAHP